MTKIISHFKKNYSKCLLLIIILYFVLSNIFWLVKDNAPTRWDDSWHLLASNYYYQKLTGQENRTVEEFASVFPIAKFAINSYPPFFKFCSVPLYLLFGFSPDVGIITNLFFYLILIFCVFILTKKLMNNKAALFACFLVSTMPLLVGLTRHYLIDFASVAMLIATFTLFVKTKNFANKKYSIFFAIIFGLAILTKVQYVILIIPTIIFLIILDIKKYGWNKKQTKNFLLMIIISVIIFLPWFLMRSKDTLRYLTGNILGGASEGDPPWHSWAGIIYYIANTSNGISFFYYILFILAIIVIIYDLCKKNFPYEKNKIILGLLFFIISATVICTYVGNKDPRYITPIFPAIAIITSIGLWKIKLNSKIKSVALILIIIFALIQLNGYTNHKLFKEKIHKGGFYIFTNYNQYLVPVSNADWKIQETLFFIEKDANENLKKLPTVAIYSDIQQFNPINFQMYAYANNITIRYLGLGSSNYKKYDYIITKEGNIRINSLKEIVKEIAQDKSYIELKNFTLPDKSSARVYKKI